MNTLLAPAFQSTVTLQPAVAGGLGLGLVLVLLLVGLISTIVWILTLVSAAKSEQWGWFVVMLVFPIVSLIYLVVGYPASSVSRGRSRTRDSGRRPARRRAS